MPIPSKIRLHIAIVRRCLITKPILLQRVRRRPQVIDGAETGIPIPFTQPVAQLVHGPTLQHLPVADRVVAVAAGHRGVVSVAERVLAVVVEAVEGVGKVD